MEHDVYETFNDLINTMIDTYTYSGHDFSVDSLSKTMKKMYNNHTLFKYTFEKFYSNARNPFITAYHEFMNLKEYETDLEDVFYIISEGILLRMLKERKYNEFIVFKSLTGN